MTRLETLSLPSKGPKSNTFPMREVCSMDFRPRNPAKSKQRDRQDTTTLHYTLSSAKQPTCHEHNCKRSQS
jgi:hypothetical protein